MRSAASAARPPGSASYSYASEESIEDMQQGLTDAIELLEGVTAWPDVGAFAVKTKPNPEDELPRPRCTRFRRVR
jgi:hypothetical protein